MGMLMHHTWQEQQKAEPAKVKPMKEEPVNEPEKTEEPVRKTGGRRKTTTSK